MGKSSNTNFYEQELRNLVRCDEELLRPVSACGRSRYRLYMYFHHNFPSLREDLYDYMTNETCYRTVEQLACSYLPEARKALDYKGDADGRVREMLERIQTSVRWKGCVLIWSRLSDETVQELALAISRCAYFLAFGLGLKRVPPHSGTTERIAGMAENLEGGTTHLRMFPCWGFKEIGISDPSEFVQMYREFKEKSDAFGEADEDEPAIDFCLINPDMETTKVNFYSLTANLNRLEQLLRLCLKKGTEEAYIDKASGQWKTAREAEHSTPRVRGEEPAEKEVRRLQQELERQRMELERTQQKSIQQAKEIDSLKSKQVKAEQKRYVLMKKIDEKEEELERLRSENQQLKASLNRSSDGGGGDIAPEADGRTGTGDADKQQGYYMDERVKRIFARAEQDGLLSREKEGYVWHESSTLLDYFLGRAFCYDYPAPSAVAGEPPVWHFDANRRLIMPVQKMNILFRRDNIGAMRRRRHMLPVPIGHQRIDAIVEKAGQEEKHSH